MKDITIIIPIHKFEEEYIEYIQKALDSISQNQVYYTSGKLIPLIVGPSIVLDKIRDKQNIILKEDVCFKENNGENDFCSQINYAVNTIETDYFSILEFDDKYEKKWFKMAHDYFYTNESVSLFLPINILTSKEYKDFQYANEIAWTSSFSNTLGFLDFDCLQDYSSFNITGGIFNTNDFKTIGGLKPSIKVSFAYEFLLRLTKKELKVFVVPKEGYEHTVGRTNSLFETYNKELSEEQIDKWFKLAKEECSFVEDRKTTIEE